MTKPEEKDLSLVPVEKLADELMTRGKTGIVFIEGLGLFNRDAYVNWVGDYYKALGLCEAMKDNIRKDSEE